MASLFQRARSLLRSPADRRLEAAAADAWSDAPKPADQATVRARLDALARKEGYGSFADARADRSGPSAYLTTREKATTIDWTQDQPPAPPQSFTFAPGYSDNTYQQFMAPQAYEGWDLDRINAAVALMRLGTFVEASNLLVAILGFAPVLAALYQAIAPILALRRHVHGGDRGISKEVAELVREMLTPASGLLPSRYFAPELWGTLAIYLRMYGFAVLQHVDGDIDPATGIRMRFTRIWEPWAVQLYRSPRKRIAWTSAGNIEIKNDGKFTFIADENEPHFGGALVALGEEAFGGKLTQAMRNNWLDFFGDPKLYATLPEKVATGSDAGVAFRTAIERIYGPAGRGVLPYGSTLDAVSISGEGSQAFRDALTDRIIHVFMVLTGSAGTIGSGAPTGAGPYQAQKGGFWNVRHDLIARPTVAIVRGVNQGHVAPFTDYNFADAKAGAKRAGTWVDPVLEIPIVSPDRDERIAGEISRYKALGEIVKAETEMGAPPNQDRINTLSEVLEVKPPALAANALMARLNLAPADIAKVVRGKEARASRGLPPFGDERDEMTIAELDWMAKQAPQGEEGGDDEQEQAGSAEGAQTGDDRVPGERDSAPEGAESTDGSDP